ncbi:hypothetical protein IQ277_19640 [Nostocales cyanobacterium LEGE 12452]|nr:hypothetical protein [Nostocales cyanobacterium LEGE 12452]
MFRKNQLVIYGLQGDVSRQAALRLHYTVETTSRYFPNINVSEVVTECLKIAYERNTSAAIREVRRKLASEN